MNHLHFDSVGGASGDMILAALLDLGIDRAWVEDELNTLGVGRFGLRTEATTDRGIRGLRLAMDLPETGGHTTGKGLKGLLGGLFGHSHEHPHTHSHARDHGHSHAHSPDAHGHGHPRRGLPEIEAILRQASLPVPVLDNCLKVFGRIAEAEAHVHNTSVDRVHFHEVGALDSIADIVGCNLCLHRLGIDRVSVAPLPIGKGTVTCAHGILPLPAPATVELLTGFPVVAIDEEKETVTPTGAALLTTWKNREAPPATGSWTQVGHGLGTHALRDRPNLLRAFLYRDWQGAGGADEVLVLECNLDDLTPELVGSVTAHLLEQGALDVFVTPIFMKKQRPAMLLTVLCKPVDRDAMLNLLFRESTTFGVRERREQRTVLERAFETVQTPYGPIRVKIGTWQGQVVTRSPEYADCAACAERAGVPVKAVFQAATVASHP